MKTKRFLFWLLSSCLLFNAVGLNVFAAQYVDTKEHWARRSINRWTNAGIVSGKQDGYFHPTDLISRAEAASIFSKLLKLNTLTDMSQFYDLSPLAWYYEDLSKVYAAGLLSGKQSDTMMLPDAPLTRQELFTMIGRSLSLKETTRPKREFLDSQNVADYAAGYTNTLINMGVIQGINDLYLAPDQPVSRAQTMAILDRVIGTYANESGRYVIRPEGVTLVVAPDVELTGPNNGYPIVVVRDDSIVEMDEVLGVPSISVNAKDIIIKNAPEKTRIQTGTEATGVVVNGSELSNGTFSEAKAPNEKTPEVQDPTTEEDEKTNSSPGHSDKTPESQNPETELPENGLSGSEKFPEADKDQSSEPSSPDQDTNRQPEMQEPDIDEEPEQDLNQEPETNPNGSLSFAQAWASFESRLPEVSNGLLRAVSPNGTDPNYYLDLNINVIKKDSPFKEDLISSGLALFKESFGGILESSSIECSESGQTYQVIQNGKPNTQAIKSLGFNLGTGIFESLSKVSGNPVNVRTISGAITSGETAEPFTVVFRLADNNSDDLEKVSKIAGLASDLLNAQPMAASQIQQEYGLQIPGEDTALVITMNLNENGFLTKLLEKVKGVPVIYNSLQMIFEQATTVDKLLNALSKYEVTNPDYLAAINTVLNNPQIVNYFLNRTSVQYGVVNSGSDGSYSLNNLIRSDATFNTSKLEENANPLKQLIEVVKGILSEETLNIKPADYKAKKDGEYAVPFKVTLKSKDKFGIDKDIEETIVLVLKADFQNLR